MKLTVVNERGREAVAAIFGPGDFFGEANPNECFDRFSQETLTEMIGTPRPQLNLFMNKFRKLGFIEYSGEIKVNDSGQEARLLRSRQGVY